MLDCTDVAALRRAERDGVTEGEAEGDGEGERETDFEREGEGEEEGEGETLRETGRDRAGTPPVESVCWLTTSVVPNTSIP